MRMVGHENISANRGAALLSRRGEGDEVRMNSRSRKQLPPLVRIERHKIQRRIIRLARLAQAAAADPASATLML